MIEYDNHTGRNIATLIKLAEQQFEITEQDAKTGKEIIKAIEKQLQKDKYK